MDLYRRFKKLNLDYSAIGLDQHDTQADYLCMPEFVFIVRKTLAAFVQLSRFALEQYSI